MQINRCSLFSHTCCVIKVTDSVSKNVSSFLRWTIKWQLIWLMSFHLVSSFNESWWRFCGTFDKLSNLWDLNLVTKANQWGIRFDIAIMLNWKPWKSLPFRIFGEQCYLDFGNVIIKDFVGWRGLKFFTLLNVLK